jgi:Tfp pilus assembly protein PilN
VAIPPTIPTSFVPKQPVTAPRKRTSGANPFLALSYIVLAVAIAGATGVFGYQYFLASVAKKKANDVVTAQKQIDQATVTEFIRLRDRFTAAKGILDSHVGLSQFFTDLEGLTLQGVQFNTLKITVTGDHQATISMTGIARSFNTLAAQSSAFASDKRIKRAIFSGITSKAGGVAFNLEAQLDPSLVVLSTAPAAPAVPTLSVPVPPAATGSTTPPAPTP